MIRQVRGEALSIGDVLTWGPSWYYQKQFFTGHTESPAAGLEHPELQAANGVTLVPKPTPKDAESQLRYDVEVSGFPSSLNGHMVLLRLKEQDYPGTKLIEDWPSWNLPILKWVRAQGGFGGYAHCGAGMVVDSTELPNYEIPPFDSIGTNEAIVDVTHGYADFISGCDTPAVAELNAWYHMLNCGFRLALVGETDYPCITGERPGRGRSYVQLEQRPVDDAGYDAWVHNLMKGRAYCGDGRSHFLQFMANGRASGADDVVLAKAGSVSIEALVAARLEPVPTPETEAIRASIDGTWHLEHARIGNTRNVEVELVVNGVAVDRKTLLADGTPQPVKFNAAIARSSWVALRISPSGHTPPVFVQAQRAMVSHVRGQTVGREVAVDARQRGAGSRAGLRSRARGVRRDRAGKRGGLMRAVIVAIAMSCSATGVFSSQGEVHMSQHVPNKADAVPSPEAAPITLTINPEARVSVVMTGAIPPAVPCGSPLDLPVRVVNQGFVTAPLEAVLVENVPAGVTLDLDVEPLKGVAEEVRVLRVTLKEPGQTDLTVAFRARNEIPDIGGRDRVHFLAECRESD
jgi:hypothetical protein